MAKLMAIVALARPSSELSISKKSSPVQARLKCGVHALAKDAHDTLIAAAHRAQADALEIEAGAKRRLADEYDDAQERGEVAKLGSNQHSEGVLNGNTLATMRARPAQSRGRKNTPLLAGRRRAEPQIIPRVRAEERWTRPLIKPFLPSRLELIDGSTLIERLKELAKKPSS
jgi:hypothetical protein